MYIGETGEKEGQMKVHYKQQHDNSCGAACLLCAAIELGITEIPESPHYMLTLGGRALEATTTCETALYQIITGQGDNIRTESWGYGMPSGIVRCARFLGLDVTVYGFNTWTIKGLSWSYAQELQTIQDLGVLLRVDAPRTNLTLQPDERELRVLLGRSLCPLTIGALHYVMVRDDGSTMEPGYGEEYPSVELAKKRIAMHGTGLSIVVSKRGSTQSSSSSVQSLYAPSV